jgi:hypothetical protein
VNDSFIFGDVSKIGSNITQFNIFSKFSHNISPSPQDVDIAGIRRRYRESIFNHKLKLADYELRQFPKIWNDTPYR